MHRESARIAENRRDAYLPHCHSRILVDWWLGNANDGSSREIPTALPKWKESSERTKGIGGTDNPER
jgi:hypothetical protein